MSARAGRWILAAATALGVGAAAVAAPGDPLPYSFVNGGVIMADQLTANLEALRGQVAELAARVDSGGGGAGPTWSVYQQFTSTVTTTRAYDICWLTKGGNLDDENYCQMTRNSDGTWYLKKGGASCTFTCAGN